MADQSSVTMTLTLAEWLDILTALQLAHLPDDPDTESRWDELATHLEQVLT